MISLEEMKEKIKSYTLDQKNKFQEVEEPWETITLYHGTTSRHLNKILKEGLTARINNQQNNFEHVPSNEHLVYLTTKWHYWYAYNANQESLIQQVGIDRYNNESITSLWNETSDFPVYLSLEVPIELLTLDEDVVYQKEIKRGIKEGRILSAEDITFETCLSQGTVASLTNLDPSYINEVFILGSEKFRNDLLDGAYGTDASLWFKGFGIGQVDMMEVLIHQISMKENKILTEPWLPIYTK